MTAKRRPEDYEAMSRAVEAGEYTVRGPVELGPTLRGGRRLTDEGYAALAADYEANPIRVDEVISIEVNPAALRERTADEPPLLVVQLPDEIRDELIRRARAEGTNASELICRAVVEYLANHPGQP
jgi:hypothetical protein